MSETTILIVGRGVIGVSTALAAKRRHPEYIIYLINAPPPSVKPASEDTAKIVRDRYNDKAYARLGAEAMDLWQAEQVYQDCWHQTGWISLDTSRNEQSIPSGHPMSKARFLEMFPETRLDDISSISEDPKTAWVEASRALEATITLAKSAGVILKNGKVTNLLWDGLTCVGVIFDDETKLTARSVLLAMGHETPFFLKRCKLSCDEGQRAGVSVLGIQLDERQYEKYKSMPILRVPGIGEILPPNRDRLMKINNSRSFLVPDISLIGAEGSHTLESPYFKENEKLLNRLLPDLKDSPIVFFRYCLDWITKTQDFCIHPQTNRKGLYVAFGGSFHAWKFLTNIGQHVVNMMDGNEVFYRDWSRWVTHDRQDLIHSEVIPKRTFPEV